MPLFLQTRKIPNSHQTDSGIFLLVEAPASSPGKQKLFWVTIPPASAARLKIALENGYNFAEFFGEA